MEIKYKLFPYPVLSPYADDYKNGKFDVSIDIVEDGYDLRIDFVASLSSDGLMDLIKSGTAKYVYHLECAQTGFRTVIQTDKINEIYMLSNKKVNGNLQICPFIVAVNDIKGYSNPDFHNDYNDVSFDIEAGCILAVSKMATIKISKDTDELSNTASIFSVVMNKDTSCNQMLVDMTGRKILIKLPLNDYYCYKQLRKTPLAQSILNAMTIVPTLTYVLEEIKSLSATDRADLEENLWYRVLSRTLLTKFNVDIESSDFSGQNYLELAQKLISDPMSDAFRLLTTGFGNSGGDEE